MDQNKILRNVAFHRSLEEVQSTISNIKDSLATVFQYLNSLDRNIKAIEEISKQIYNEEKEEISI